MKNATETKSQRNDVTLRKDFIRCWVHANPTVGKEKASTLYDAMIARFPDMTRGGHRGMVGRMNPWETIEHECPNCGKHATGLQEIKDTFGLRLQRGKVYNQSYCPPCRALYRQNKHKGNGDVRINPEVEDFHTN